MNDTLTLRNDYLFKLLLGSEENKSCLQDFLECVLDIPSARIEDLELLDKELAKDTISDKTGILDVKLRLKDGTFKNIRPCIFLNCEFRQQPKHRFCCNQRHPYRY